LKLPESRRQVGARTRGGAPPHAAASVVAVIARRVDLGDLIFAARSLRVTGASAAVFVDPAARVLRCGAGGAPSGAPPRGRAPPTCDNDPARPEANCVEAGAWRPRREGGRRPGAAVSRRWPLRGSAWYVGVAAPPELLSWHGEVRRLLRAGGPGKRARCAACWSASSPADVNRSRPPWTVSPLWATRCGPPDREPAGPA